MHTRQPSDLERLAVLEHERRQALYEARKAEGDRPSSVPDLAVVPRVPTLPGIGDARDKLPTLDDLTSSDDAKARPARWRLVLVFIAALGGLGEFARQISVLIAKH